jgi:hypothetical protein
VTTWLQRRRGVVGAAPAASPPAGPTTANLDGPSVSWTDDRRPFARHRLLLGVVSTVFNHDRDSAEADGGAQELSTMATVVVQVQAESAHDTASTDALWLLEQVRLGLRRVSVRAALAAADGGAIAIVGWPLATVSRSYPADNRIVSAHSFDVALRFVLDFDTTGEDAGLIEHLEADGAGDLLDLDFAVDDPTPEP